MHRFCTYWLPMFLCGWLLVGCGSSKTSAGSGLHFTPAPLARTAPVTESAPAALASCKRAITEAAKLPTQSKSELAEVCGKINGVIADDQRLIKVVCNEVANSSSGADAPDRSRARSECLVKARRLE